MLHQIAGTSVPEKGTGNGVVKVFDLEMAQEAGEGGTSECQFNISVVPGNSAVCVSWHPTIQHIAVGGADAVTRVLYDPTISHKGVLLSSSRPPKRCVVCAPALAMLLCDLC